MYFSICSLDIVPLPTSVCVCVFTESCVVPEEAQTGTGAASDWQPNHGCGVY